MTPAACPAARIGTATASRTGKSARNGSSATLTEPLDERSIRSSWKAWPTIPSPALSEMVSRSSRRKPRPARATRREPSGSQRKSMARSAVSNRETRSMASEKTWAGSSPEDGMERISWPTESASHSSGFSTWVPSGAAGRSGDGGAPGTASNRRRRSASVSRIWRISLNVPGGTCPPVSADGCSSVIGNPQGFYCDAAGLVGITCLLLLRRRRALLGSERADVADQGPAVALGQEIPGRHSAPSGADLPEDLSVRLGLHLRGRPVRGFRVQRHRGRAVALALRPMTGHAIDVGHLLALRDRLRVGRQRVLLVLLPCRRDPRRLRMSEYRRGDRSEEHTSEL